MPILYNFSDRIEAKGIFPDSFNEANIAVITKSDKDITEKKTTDQYFSLF